MRLSCQLYTLREPLASDPEKTLESLRETGLEFVETAGVGSLTADEARKVFDRLGFTVSASHIPLSLLESDTAKAIADAQAYGTETIVLPWLEEKDRTDFAALAERIKPIAEKVLAAGFRFAYHNHNFEFESRDGKLGIDAILEANPALEAQFDLGWIHYAGYEPTDWLTKYTGRINSVHLKDSRRGHSKMDLAAGEGELDYEALIPASEKAGASYAAVEVDEPRGDALETVRGCISLFHKLGLR